MWTEHPQTQFGIRVHQMKGEIQNSDFFSVIIAHYCQLHTFLGNFLCNIYRLISINDLSLFKLQK